MENGWPSADPNEKHICSICGKEIKEDPIDEPRRIVGQIPADIIRTRIVVDLEKDTIICADCFDNMEDT